MLSCIPGFDVLAKRYLLLKNHRNSTHESQVVRNLLNISDLFTCISHIEGRFRP